MAGIYGDNKSEFVTSMAALALYDGEAEVTAENIKTLLDASKNTVEVYWPGLFASALKGDSFEKMLYTIGGGAAPAAAAAAPGAAAEAAAAPAAAAKPKEEEVDTLDGGMDMFGGGGGGGDY